MFETLLEAVPHDAPLLVLGYAHDTEPCALFPKTFGLSEEVDAETVQAVIADALAGESGSGMERDVAPLPAAPPKKQIVPTVGEKLQAEAEEEREALMEWTAALRDICNHILDAKRFRAFHNKVEENEVPDYAKLIPDPIWVKKIHERVGKMHYLR